jgi:hypothetical protein
MHSAIDIPSFPTNLTVLLCRLEAKSVLQRGLAAKYHYFYRKNLSNKLRDGTWQLIEQFHMSNITNT